MSHVSVHTPIVFTDEQWAGLLEAFSMSAFAYIIENLRNAGNLPQHAKDILKLEHLRIAEDRVNAVFRIKKLPYILGRTDVYSQGEDKSMRLLALVLNRKNRTEIA